VNGGDQVQPQYDTVAMFRTDDLTGEVTAALGTVPAGTTPESMTVDPTGRFAYVVNSGSDNVSMYTIEAPTGRLVPLPQATVLADSFPWWVTVDPSGQFAYVANHGVDTISLYRIDSTTGQLIPNGTLPTGSGPAAVVIVTPQALWLRVNQTSVQPGVTLLLTALIRPWRTLTQVDLYLALQLPDQTVVFLQADGTPTAEPRPFMANWDVSVPFTRELVSLTFNGTEPVGRYRWLAVFTEPGTTTLLGTIAQAPFIFSPAGQG
jgi:lactonase family protein with 7-bladed beta-propeller